MLTLLATLASAQETPAMDAQVFHSSVDGRVGFSLDDAHVAPDNYWAARAALQYVNKPLVYYYEDGTEVPLLSDLVGIDVLGGYSYKRLRVGLDLPVYVVAAGQDLSGGAQMGDIGVDGKYVLLDPESSPVGLAGDVRLLLPTGGSSAPVGSHGVGVDIALAASKTIGDWTVAANLGHHGVPAVELQNITWGSQLTLRAGVAKALSDDAGLSLELGGSSVYSSFLADPAASPFEGMIGGWYRFNDNAVGRLGLGTGLTSGIGAPVARVIASVGFEPREIRDADKDGIVDKQDACPTDPEDMDEFEDKDGCPDPDNDKDGLADAADHCPNDAEDKDEWKDDDGCPDLQTDVSVFVVDKNGAPIPGATVSLGEATGESGMSATVIPGAYPFHATAPDWVTLDESIDIVNGPPKKVVRVMQPEIKGGVLELRVSKADGTPLDATWRADGDAVSPAAAGHASKKLLPGSHEIHVFANGYASVAQNVAITLGQTTNLAVVMQPARVVMTTQKLEILDKVFFDTNKTTIKKISYPLLNEVARVLLDHPEIVMVRVEGHTDSRGSDVANLKLSDGRAKAVRAYLIKAGVAPDRLNAVGYGETKPVDPADNEAAWEKNRRVEFVIEQRKDQ